jgi:hypothetical protein
VSTGETHTIGTPCAERVGLDKAELKRFLADKYAEERYEASKAGREAARLAAEAREVADTKAHGEHGTESRYLSGCYCDHCLSVAPHATLHRFFNGNCRCLDCIGFVLTELPKEFFVAAEANVVVDIETGQIVPAKIVSTKYGARWCVNDGAAWLPVRPKRRTTLTNKGYTEATVPMLMKRCGHGRDSWSKPICQMGAPIADRWGERIERVSA